MPGDRKGLPGIKKELRRDGAEVQGEITQSVSHGLKTANSGWMPKQPTGICGSHSAPALQHDRTSTQLFKKVTA